MKNDTSNLGPLEISSTSYYLIKSLLTFSSDITTSTRSYSCHERIEYVWVDCHTHLICRIGSWSEERSEFLYEFLEYFGTSPRFRKCISSKVYRLSERIGLLIMYYWKFRLVTACGSHRGVTLWSRRRNVAACTSWEVSYRNPSKDL